MPIVNHSLPLIYHSMLIRLLELEIFLLLMIF